jgi:hypothetical protein
MQRLDLVRFNPSLRRLVPCLLIVAAVIAAPTASGGRPASQTLTPPPPDFLVCKAVGSGTICEGSRTLQHGPMDVSEEGGPAFTCGTGADAFTIVDRGYVDQHVVRYYNENGELTRRVIHELWRSAQFSNSVTGAALPYKQSDTITDELAVPGDFGTSTQTITGNGTNVTVPHEGTIFLQAGRNVFGPDGTLDFLAGPDAAIRYFLDGDISVWQRVCAALGAH